MKIGIISDYAKVFSGYAFASEDLVNDGVPVIKIGNIQNGIVNKECDSCYSKVISKKLEKYLLKDTDFLIAMTGAGSVGRAGIMIEDKGNYLINQRVAIVRANENANREYLYYFFRLPYIERFLYSLGIGAGQPNISPNDILKLKSMFHLEESQTKISTILFAYDKLIEINNKRIKALEQMAENLYKEWFVRFRFPGYETTEFENGIPKGWTYCRIKELFEIKYGKDHKNIAEGKIPIFGSGGIMRYGDKAIYSNESVLIPRKGTLNNILYVNEPFWTVDTMFYTILLKPNFAKYAYYTLASVDMESYNSGAALPSMTTDILYHLRILVPDNRTLKLFDEFISDINMQKKKIEVINNNLTKQRDLLLPRLMSGKLEV